MSFDADALGARLFSHLESIHQKEDGVSLSVLDVLVLVPVAMELAAEVGTLNGEERLDLATRGMLVGLARLEPDAFGGEEEKKEVLRVAETLVPSAATLLYSAYKRRHVFRRSWARRWAKCVACVRRG
jgi:hypothetical protein